MKICLVCWLSSRCRRDLTVVMKPAAGARGSAGLAVLSMCECPCGGLDVSQAVPSHDRFSRAVAREGDE